MTAEPQEVKPVTSILDADHSGLLRMKAQAQPVEDDPHPSQPFSGLPLGLAEHDHIVGIPHQSPETSTTVLPESIQLMKDYIRE